LDNTATASSATQGGDRRTDVAKAESLIDGTLKGQIRDGRTKKGEGVSEEKLRWDMQEVRKATDTVIGGSGRLVQQSRTPGQAAA